MRNQDKPGRKNTRKGAEKPHTVKPGSKRKASPPRRKPDDKKAASRPGAPASREKPERRGAPGAGSPAGREKRTHEGPRKGPSAYPPRKKSSPRGDADKPWHAGKRTRERQAREERPEKAGPDRQHADVSGLTRLNKYIANSGICSRREADKLIEAGAVTVNGEVVSELGYKISPGDVVQYGGTPVRTGKNVYVLLNKPKDYITTTDDPMNRRTVMALVAKAGRERIYPVGRLDRATTGLLLLTNDGDITRKLTHPSQQVRKIYHVELDQPLKTADMNKIRAGVELEDGPLQVDAIDYVGAGENRRMVGVELHSGRNRVVRRLFESLEYTVVKLDRVYFAGLTKKDLPRGRWRFLTEMEVNMLRMQTGKKKQG